MLRKTASSCHGVNAYDVLCFFPTVWKAALHRKPRSAAEFGAFGFLAPEGWCHAKRFQSHFLLDKTPLVAIMHGDPAATPSAAMSSRAFWRWFWKRELDERFRTRGERPEWADTSRYLAALRETEVCQDSKRYILRAPIRPAATAAFRVAGVAIPQTVRLG